MNLSTTLCSYFPPKKGRRALPRLAIAMALWLFLGLPFAAMGVEEGTPCTSDPQNISYGSLTICTIDPVGDTDIFNFSGAAGQTVSIQVTRQGGGTPQVCLYRPDGTLVSYSATNTQSAVSLTPALDQTGLHAIRVNENGNNATMGYNLTLGCLAGDCGNECGDPGDPNCFVSGSGASYLKVCVSGDGTLEEFQSPAGSQQLAAADDLEGYALCSGTGAGLLVHGYDAGLDESGFGAATLTQPGGPGTFPLTIVRETVDGLFELTQKYARDSGEKDFTITMTLKNLSASPITRVKLARYFNGDMDGDGADDLYDRTLDTVWGTQGPSGHGLGLFAKSATSHATRVEYASAWDPGVCDVAGVTPDVANDYAGRITYNLGTINAGASKTVYLVYRRQ